jgi:hypothetical protein
MAVNYSPTPPVAGASRATKEVELWTDLADTLPDIDTRIDTLEAAPGGGAVDSVNGETGVVVLDAGDIAFTPAGTIAAATVQAAIEEVATEAGGAAPDADAVAITDVGGYYTGTDVEAALQEIGAAGVGGGSSLFRGCRLTKSADQSVTASTFAAVTWDQEDIDTDGFHDTTSNTSRLTIPTGLGGVYRVTGTLAFSSVSDQNDQIVALYINGVEDVTSRIRLGASYANSTTSINIPFSWLVQLAAGDYIEVYGRTTDTTTPTIRGSDSHAALEYLGPLV